MIKRLTFPGFVITVILASIFTVSLSTENLVASCSGVSVASGTSLQSAISANATGTTFCLDGKYITSNTITPKNSDTFFSLTSANISSTGSGPIFSGGNNVTYNGLDIGPSAADGIRPGSGSVITNSHFHDNPWCAINSVGNYVQIINNDIGPNNGTVGTSSACGIKIHGVNGKDLGAYSTISGNTVHDNGANALWVDCDGHDNTFNSNTIYGNGGAALDDETSYDNTWTNNVIHDNGFLNSRYAVSVLNTYGSTVQGNILTHNYRGIRMWQDNRGTVTTPQPGTGCADATLSGYITSHITITNNKINGLQRSGFPFNGAVRPSAAFFDYNCWSLRSLTDKAWMIPNNANANWTQWRKTGEDPHGIIQTTACL